MIADPPDGRHVFSVDVEEYFQVNAFDSTISRQEWDSLPARIDRGVDGLLELLDAHDVPATFFCLGWIADRNPHLIRRIAARGHEIASHGWWHRRVTELEPEEFREDVRSSRRILEDLVGRPVRGYRAPSFSIVPGREWALDILIEEGYEYDSSLYPVRRIGYGYPGAPSTPHLVRRGGGEILELPPATAGWLGLRLPAGGGAYFRQLPYGITRRAFEQATERGECAVFYIHPWELDPDQPRLPVPPVSKLRHYGGLSRTVPRLRRLLSSFRFTSVARRFGLEGDPSGRREMRVLSVH